MIRKSLLSLVDGLSSSDLRDLSIGLQVISEGAVILRSAVDATRLLRFLDSQENAMIRLGMLIGELIKDNPVIMVMVSEKTGAGTLVEVQSIKIAESDTGKIVVLTI